MGWRDRAPDRAGRPVRLAAGCDRGSRASRQARPRQGSCRISGKEAGWAGQLAKQIGGSDDDDDSAAPDAFSRIGAQQRAAVAQALGDARRMATGAAIQARCLECAGVAPAQPSNADTRLLDLVLARLGF